MPYNAAIAANQKGLPIRSFLLQGNGLLVVSPAIRDYMSLKSSDTHFL
jgi:hypothetical protein